MSIEDILGSPEEYRAGQAKAAAKKKERLDHLVRQMYERFGDYERQQRTAFEAFIMNDAHRFSDHPDSLTGRVNGDGEYFNGWVQAEWNGWWNAMNQAHLRLGNIVVMLPAEDHERFCSLTDLNLILRCYITQMVTSWGVEAFPRKHAMDAVEWMTIHASQILTEEELRELTMLLVNTDTMVAEKRFTVREQK